MKFVSTIAIASALVMSGCGGGGGGGGGDSTATPPKATPALAKYVGQWRYCEPDGTRNTLTTSLAANESLDISNINEYFASNDCTGAIVATRSVTYTTNAVRTGAQDVSFALPPSVVATNIALDNLSVAFSAGTVNYAGSGVSRDSNGSWCVARSNGSSCESSAPRTAGISAVSMYTTNNKLYIFTPSGTTVKLDTTYTKI